MTIQYSLAVKTARAQALAAKIDGAATPGKIRIYSGPQPDNLGAVTTQTLLVELVMQKPCARTVEDGIIYLAAIDDQMVAGTDIAAWARILDGADSVIGDLLVGVTGSGADLTLPTVNLVQGSFLRISAGQIREG